MRTNPAVQKVEAKYLRKDIPDFHAGNTVVVKIRVREGTRERLQSFEGVVIGMRHRGLNSSFTVRRIAYGIGVEKTFQTHSPLIESVTIKRRGDVRKAKLYYLRQLAGRKARIREKIEAGGADADLIMPQEEEFTTETEAISDDQPQASETDTEDQAETSTKEQANNQAQISQADGDNQAGAGANAAEDKGSR